MTQQLSSALVWNELKKELFFAGKAQVFEARNVEGDILHALFHGLESDPEKLATMCVLEIEPLGDFVTFGIGIPLMQMRYPDQARGRAPVTSAI